MNLIRKVLSYPLHPYLVCLYCLTKANADLHISAHYWSEILSLLMIFCSITAVLQFVFKFLWSSNTNGSIVLSIALFINFFLFPIHKTINYILPFVERVRYSFLIAVIISFIIALFLFIKRKKQYAQTSQYLTILLLLFIGIDVSKWIYDAITDSKETLLQKLTIAHKTNNYNIYLIVPDGYAANENLKKYWQLDNGLFLSNLKNKNFFVAQNPHSNYHYTVESISSMLKMDYFTTSVTEPLMEASISNNTAMQFLDTHKYKCTITDFNEHSYTYDPNKVKTDIKAFLYDQSAAYFLGIPLFIKDRNTVNNIEILKNIFKVEDTIPVFRYVHSMITHFPFTNKETDIVEDTAFANAFGVQTYQDWTAIRGNDYRTLGKRGDSILLKKYLGKIKETNAILQKTLDESWDNIKSNSIVIIMSDHGFRCLNGPPEDYKAEAYQNFCAIYFPDQDYSTLTDTITPINVIRMVVNKAVGTNMPYLPDKTNLR
jgi:hypothetical protein